MRPIKFRAWCPENKKWLEDFSINKNGIIIENNRNFTYIHVKAILEQFTGLQDRNGNDIYEGDIIKYKNNSLSIVEWLPCGAYNICLTFPVSEIIGNIHENGDFLCQ